VVPAKRGIPLCSVVRQIVEHPIGAGRLRRTAANSTLEELGPENYNGDNRATYDAELVHDIDYFVPLFGGFNISKQFSHSVPPVAEYDDSAPSASKSKHLHTWKRRVLRRSRIAN
jgi:hypothetical protein